MFNSAANIPVENDGVIVYDSPPQTEQEEDMRILIAEDERKLGKFMKAGLVESGFEVDWTMDGDEALKWLTKREYAAAVLDIMLPGRDGLSVLRQLRKAGNTLPVIVATARTSLDERVEGLELGADDYLPKPFYVEELVARVRALVRRGGAGGGASNKLAFEDIVLDLVQHSVTRAGETLSLTAREFSLLELFMRSPNRVFTRTQLLERVWGYDFDPETNVVDVAVRRVRKKIGDTGDPAIISAVRGVGYRLGSEERADARK